MSDFTAYSVGLICASVCTSLSDEEAAERLNLTHPTGIASQWEVSPDQRFVESPTPATPCHDCSLRPYQRLYNYTRVLSAFLLAG